MTHPCKLLKQLYKDEEVHIIYALFLTVMRKFSCIIEVSTILKLTKTMKSNVVVLSILVIMSGAEIFVEMWT